MGGWEGESTEGLACPHNMGEQHKMSVSCVFAVTGRSGTEEDRKHEWSMMGQASKNKKKQPRQPGESLPNFILIIILSPEV